MHIDCYFIVKKCALYKLQHFYTLLFMNFEEVYIDVLKTFLKFKLSKRIPALHSKFTSFSSHWTAKSNFGKLPKERHGKNSKYYSIT